MAERQYNPCSERYEQKSSSGVIPQLSQKKEASILVLGKTGSGKSSIINAMLTGEVAKTSSGSSPTKHHSVEIHQRKLGEVTVTMYDTRGFFDQEKCEDVILNDISRECTDGFDLMLICLNMTDKIDRSINETLRNLSKLKGELWKQSVFVLTFTNHWLNFNDVCDRSNKEKRDALKEQIDVVKKDVGKCAEGIISKKIFDEIPFVLAGSIKYRELIQNDNNDAVTVSNDTERHVVAATEDWLAELWHVCGVRCSDTKKPLLHSFKYRLLAELAAIGGAIAAGVGIGAGIGACGGVFVGPIGIAVGASVGCVIGGIVGSGVSIGAVGVGRMTTKSETK